MTHDDAQVPRTPRGGGDEARDLALVARIARGDRAALAALYRDFYPRLYRFVLRVLARSDAVEDVVNETMLAVWQQAAGFREASRVGTWIFGIAYRRALKALARERRPQPPPEPATVAMPPELTDADERRAAVARAIASLPPDQRAVVELTFAFGHSYGEIAAILGCPEGTVKSRMFHARARLRPLLRALAEE
ncbi:MAG TPA: sigma-70 family RNA polymerase sigma factor [Xanthomonadales bacterium]|nr:sigma-70 family RNA polymerase sigma factor [Xanthomonadales bacterium]